MRTPKIFSENIKNNIITTSMLEEALFSVNKRAKNYRDKEREYRHIRGEYGYKNAKKMAEIKEDMYKKKTRLLSIVEPICIHKEFAGYETVRVYAYQKKYKKKYEHHLQNGTIVWDLDYENSYFEYENLEHPKYRYYLYYVVGEHTFHRPIKKTKNYNLPIKEIDTLETFGKEIKELVSLQFVDKMLELIEKTDFRYEEDKESVVPEFPEYHRENLVS